MLNIQRPLFYPLFLFLALTPFLHAQATPPVAIAPNPAGVKVQWTPSLDSANFFQTSTNLRDWSYIPEAISGTDTTRVLDFPTTRGSKFFRAIKRPYSGTNAINEDFDGDGLITRDELLLFRTDPLAPDSDGDGQSDGAEDSDQDGIPDAVESLAGLDPNDPTDATADSDQDGLSNLAEYLAGTNLANLDTDGDTLSDGWEKQYGDPKLHNDSTLDADGDGLTAKTEQLINTNPALTDTDADGINDGAEDADADGVSNLAEQIAGTNPADFHSGQYLTLQILTGNAQTLSAGDQSAPITLKFTHSSTGLPAVNAPILIIRTGSGSINGDTNPRVSFTTPANGQITFTFQTDLNTLPGASPILVWIPSLPLQEYKGQVDLQVASPSALRASSLTAQPSPTAHFPSLMKLATITTPAPPEWPIPFFVNARGQVTFNSSASITVWDGSALQVIYKPGHLQTFDINSNGDIVGNTLNGMGSSDKRYAFHFNINTLSYHVVPPATALLFHHHLETSQEIAPPHAITTYSNDSSKSYAHTKFTILDESGNAYGMYDNIFKYTKPNNVFSSYNTGYGTTKKWSDWREDRAIHTPASYSIKNHNWANLYGGFPTSYTYYQKQDEFLNPLVDIGPHAVSPDGSKLIFGHIIDYRLLGWVPGKYYTPQARPYLGPLNQLPAPIIAVNDAGVIVGSFASQPWSPILEHPFVYANGKLVYLTPQDGVLGVSNLPPGKPMTIIGNSGIWCQKVVPSTGLPMDPSKGSNAFAYKTYNQLNPENILGLTNLRANSASKESTALVLNGINSAGQKEYITALFGGAAVDMDRDGEINFEKDRTTVLKPYRFWVNDDRDIGHSVDKAPPPVGHNGDWEQDDVNADEQPSPDCDLSGLQFARDLEDLTRIWIDFSSLIKAFPTSDPTVALKVRIDADLGTPKVNLFKHVESDGGREYLKSEGIGYNQIQGIYAGELCRVSGSTSVEVPRWAWKTLPSGKVLHLLFEGAKEGDGKLIFELWKNGVKVLDLPPVFLRLRKADDFYETWTVGDVADPEITGANNNYSAWPAATALPKLDTGRDLTAPEKPEEKDYIMFVHGWNMAPSDKTQFADTMFKRLWHQGFKGRFGAYRWPTFYTPSIEFNNFNGSEERAWNSAAPLAALLQDRSTIFNVGGSSRVRLFGHSMGNIVCSEALRSLWPTAPVHTYVSGQAALAAHCWDAYNPRWMPYGAHWSNTANIYRSYWQSSAGSDAPHKWETSGRPSYMHSSYMPGNVKYVNHHNVDDWALSSWELNQKLKPSVNYHYGWVPGTTLGSEHRFYKNLLSPTMLVCPADRFQIFSWASEARSYATGAEPATRGMFSVRVDLKTTFGFDGNHKGHSAQFRSTIQKRWAYWKGFLNDNSISTP